MAESTNNPLHYFEELLTSNKYETLKRNFVSELKEQAGTLIHSSDIENGIVKVEYNDGGKIGISTIVFHDDFLEEILIEENKVISNIDNSVIEISKTNSSFSKFLKLQISNIYILEENAKKHYPEIAEIPKTLNNILHHIVDRYKLNQSYKKQNLEIDNTISYFGLKHSMRLKDLIEVYDLSIDLEIFDDEVVSEDDFTSILTGDLKNSKSKIIFNCNNQIAVHYIISIQHLFNQLSFSRISKSEKFYTKGGKLINQSDLDTANTRLKKNQSSFKEKISSAFNSLEQ